MTPQEMKSSILQLAVQGRPAEQRPEEGTGKRCIGSFKEKSESSSAGKLKKEKPLPDIAEDEALFEII